jgi:hypothetical protein
LGKGSLRGCPFCGSQGWRALLPTLAAQKQRVEGGAPGFFIGKNKSKNNYPTQAKEA